MSNPGQTHYFDRDIWIDADNFHCHSRDIALRDIRRVYINFRVNTVLIMLFAMLICLVGLAHGYFNFGNLAYLWMIPLVLTFAGLRYMLKHYVELFIVSQEGTQRIFAAGMSRRNMVYEMEDSINHRIKELTADK